MERFMNHSLLPLGAALLALGLGALPAAQAQNVKPPKAQLWMDVSTGGMAGMPEMDASSGMGAMLGGLMGGAGGGAGGNTTYGMARGMTIMPPRVLDIALYNRLKPGVEAAQLIPSGMRMGDKLPLLPPPPAQPVKEREPTEVPQEYQREAPKGRILIYWGCGAEVRPGQPRIIDLARGNPADFGSAFAGRFAPDRGARVGPGYVLYPNERNRVSLSRDSSLVGEHQIQGDGVPANFKFALAAAQDVMPAIELQSSGSPKDSIALSWRSVNQARAYFLHAMGSVGENDMVMWSSSDIARQRHGPVRLPAPCHDRPLDQGQGAAHARNHAMRHPARHFRRQGRRLRPARRQLRWHAAHDRLRQRKQFRLPPAPGRPQGGLGAGLGGSCSREVQHHGHAG
jgi:hypothetical protein